MTLYFNKRGQALVETLVSLPVLMAGGALVLAGLHSLCTFYLVDHWTYESALCLAQEKSTCRKELDQRLMQIPYASVAVRRFYKRGETVEVRAQLSTPLLRNVVFNESFRQPLSSGDFRRSQ